MQRRDTWGAPQRRDAVVTLPGPETAAPPWRCGPAVAAAE
jgi:hypothetical protein